MRTTNSLVIALGFTLVAAPACDGLQDDGVIPDDGAVEFRCQGPGCTTGGNTPIYAGLALQNMKEAVDHQLGSWGVGAASESGTFTVNGATISHLGEERVVERYYLDMYHNLVATYENTGGGLVWLHKDQVEGLTFNTTFTPNAAGALPIDRSMKIIEARCSALSPAQAPGIKACTYLMGVALLPTDLLPFPQLGTPDSVIYYAMCPTATEYADEIDQVGVMFVDRLALDTTGTQPELSYSYYNHIPVCKASALAKAQWQWAVSLNWNSPWDRAARSADHAHSIVFAINAWLDGKTTTKPESDYCLEDSQANFLGNCAGWEVEGGVGPDGFFCTNQDGPLGNGVHRAYADPNADVPGWKADGNLVLMPSCETFAEAAALADDLDIADFVVSFTHDLAAP